MDGGPSTLDFVTLGIALWGAGFSTYLAVAKRRVRLRVSAEFGVARLGDVRNHSFFIVSVVNVGERAVSIREVEWEAESMSSTLVVFRHSKGRELPVKVEPDEELQILFDSDHAAKALERSKYGAKAISVLASGQKGTWRVDVTESMRDEAEDHLEHLREVLGEDEAE